MRQSPGVVEKVLVALELAVEAVSIDTGAEGLVGEVELTHTYRRTGRSPQLADHTSCTASSSALFEIRARLALLCLCSSQTKCHGQRMLRQNTSIGARSQKTLDR